MANGFDFKRLRRQIVIYVVVQIFLVALLVFMALNFQGQFQAKGTPRIFINSIVATLVIQLMIFYPLNKFAAREAEQEIAACKINLSPDEMKEQRRKRLYGDFIKAAIFIFFLTFIARSPAATFVMSTTFFTFILTILTYFQCFNFAAKRGIRAKG
ncbi:MAG: hypothetical protein FD174_583 [Geobacteraceae bacterium]|nr:MAG: hypothetical protein FD174_583 [Geobacteraceae bacterium]